MTKVALAVASLGIALVPALSTTPASAASDVTYVTQSGSGSTCSLALPCGSVQTAINNTNGGGDVFILDAGNYVENLTITQGIGITGQTPQGPIIRATTADAGSNTNDTITINAGPNANVTLSNLNIYPDRNGIVFNSGRQLNVNSGSNANGAVTYGLLFQPNTAASGDGVVRLLLNASFSGHAGGVLIKPSNGVVVYGLIENLRTNNSSTGAGVTIDNTGGSGTMAINIQESRAYHNATDGYSVVGGGAGVMVVTLDRNTMADNTTAGVSATGAGANVLVTGSTLTGNGTGISSASGAVASDFDDNAMLFNASNFSGPVHHILKH
jgi:hypothetical protein